MHTIEIEIIYALPNIQPNKIWRKVMQFNRGTSPLEAIKESGLLEDCPELLSLESSGEELSFGVFSKRIDDSYLLTEGDRLEIYRKLTADPKEVRREMAKAGKTMTDSR